MRIASRLAVAAALVFAPLTYADAQGAGKTLAMDFRMTNVVQGMPDTGVIVGHAVGTSDKMRLDVSMKGANARVTPLADSAVTMIVTDSGKTITYLDVKKSQFLRVRPAEMVAQAQQMGGMKMDFSETSAKVDSLGAGPAILGHPTSHYRVTTGMTMTISAMGQQQTVKIASSNDAYYATDIRGYLNPFTTLTGGDMAAIFGTTNKDFGDKMKAVQQKLPKGTALRALSTATIVAQGQTRITNSAAEVTGIQWVDTDPKAFEVPSTYTATQLPGMGGSSSGAIPPK
ncbi:MAG TPA: hypothetical protein VN927_07010 [Gemmatimonadaceae bacterium]|nr:hypothetical protein [Gemmatimonadaceae bacterium]